MCYPNFTFESIKFREVIQHIQGLPVNIKAGRCDFIGKIDSMTHLQLWHCGLRFGILALLYSQNCDLVTRRGLCFSLLIAEILRMLYGVDLKPFDDLLVVSQGHLAIIRLVVL